MKNRNKQTAELRKRAEAVLLDETPYNITHLSPEEIKKTLHDLRVHQIELEMQNEELRRTQAELDVSSKRYFDLYNLAPVGYCTISGAGLIQEANLTTAFFLGLTRSELINQAITNFVHHQDQGIYYLFRKKLMELDAPQHCDLRVTRKDGTLLWVQLHAIAAHDSDGAPMCQLVLSDITERKQVVEARREDEVRQREQEMLRINETRLREVLEHSQDAAYKRNLQTGAYEYLSLVIEQLTGYPPEEMMTFSVDTVLAFMHRDDVAEIERVIAESMTDVTRNTYLLEYRFQRKDGQYRWLQDQFTVQRDADGHPMARIGSVSDITERKRADAALQDKRLRLANIIEATRVGTWEWNIQTGAVVFNERWAQMIGYSLADLPAVDIAAWEFFAHPDDLQQSYCLLDRHFSGELPYYDFECRMKHRDGHWIWVHDRGRVLTRTKEVPP